MQSAAELLGRRIPRESDAYQHGARRSGVAHAPCDVKQYGCQRRAPIIEPGIVIEGVGRVVYFTPGASSAVENTSPTGTAAVAWMPTEMRKSVTFSKWGGYVAITIPKPTIVPPRRHVKFGDAFRTLLSRRTEVEMAPRPLPSTRSKHTSRSCRAAPKFC